MKIHLTFIIKKVLLLLIILSSTNIIFGQSPFFKQHKIFKNKKDYTVNVIFQDKTGYMWFGTNVGLARFDGNQFTYFTEDDSLANKNITALYQDNDGTIWIGDNRGGISKYSKNRIVQFDPEEGLSSAPITSLFVDSKNTLWFSTEGEGVYYYSGKRKRLYNLWDDEGVSDHTYCFEEDGTGKIWIGSDNGISIFDTKEEITSSISMKNGLPDNIVKHIEKTNDGHMIIGMEESGIIYYDIEKEVFLKERKLMLGSVNNFISQNSNEIWVSTKRNGIFRIHSTNDKQYETQYFSEKHGLINNNTSTVFIDRENNLWVGSKNGVTRCNLSTFEFINEKDGIQAKAIYDMVFIGNKKWICSDKGLIILEKDKMGNPIITKVLDKRHPNTTFISLFNDSKGFIWAGTYNEGVFRIDTTSYKYEIYNKVSGLADNNVISISGNDSILWFSTLGGGVSYCNINEKIKFHTFNSENGLKSNYVYQTFIDSKRNIWFAQDGGGLTLFSNNQFYHFGENEGLKSNSIYGLTEDNSGNIWMISSDKGIIKYNGKEFESYNENSGLITSIYSGISYNINNELVLISNEGIEVLNTSTNNITRYGEESGVAYLEPNLNSVYKDDDNLLWIGTNKGIIKFNPNREESKEILPNIVITKKQAYFEEILDSTIHLKYDENHMIFNYTGLWFTSPENLTYKYILEGYDLDWNLAGNSKTQTYSNLPPGDYTFKVMVSHIPGVWTGSEDAEFSFTIKPPFWQTWWFISISVILILFIIYSVFRVRLRNLTKQKEELEEEVKRRTAKILNQKEEIETQKDEIEYQNKEIRHSINYASRIQTALIKTETIEKDISDHFVIWIPRDIVSGDFYWIREVNEKIFYVASDSTGHGVPGAFMSMLGISFLDELILRRNLLKPSDILEELRKQIKHSLSQGGENIEQKDGMDMALTVIDKKTLKMEYAGAYNPLYLFRDRNLIEYKATRNPVGIYAKEVPFINNDIDLIKNDMIYIFSDGFVDQFGGEKGQKYKTRNFKKYLEKIHDKNLNDQKKLLESELSEWMNNSYSQIDDILIIGIRIK